MSSLLNIGVSALSTNRSALSTIGHNIANVHTAGYSRQSVATEAHPGQDMGRGFVGKGVMVSTVVRHYSELLGRQANATTAISSADASRFANLNRMQDIFSGGEDGLGAGINNMLNAFGDVETAPTDATARNVVLTRMSELAARFRSAATTFDDQEYAARQEITNNAALVTKLAAEVATLNGQISRALATGHEPNDLLDARDELIRTINRHIQVSTVTTDHGHVSLFIGGSQPLVLGITSGVVATGPATDYPGSGRQALYFTPPADGVSQPGQLGTVELTHTLIGGGAVAGLLKFANEDLIEGRNLLGRLAMVIGHELNWQNRLGLTLKGDPGEDLFAVQTEAIQGYTNIEGYNDSDPSKRLPAATAELIDSRALRASDYYMAFDTDSVPRKVILTRQNDGSVHTFNYPGVNQDFAAELDGLRFSVPAATLAAARRTDSVLFSPFGNTAKAFEALTHNPDELAASSAISADIARTNRGQLQLTRVGAEFEPPAYGAGQYPSGEVRIKFTDDAGGYVLQTRSFKPDGTLAVDWTDTATKGVFVPGQPIAFTGEGAAVDLSGSITLTGRAFAGDVVTLSDARFPSDGQNVGADAAAWAATRQVSRASGYRLNAGNASAFLALRDTPAYDDGTTIADGFSATMAIVGARTQSAKYAADFSSTVSKNLDADRSAISGVDKDEEAARLLQYQQAYQASAKVIQIAQTLFDSVLQAVGR